MINARTFDLAYDATKAIDSDYESDAKTLDKGGEFWTA